MDPRAGAIFLEAGMKRISSLLVVSAALLGGAAHANPPRWFPFDFGRQKTVSGPQSRSGHPAIHDPAVELAAMQQRTVMIQAPAGSGTAAPSVQMVNSRSLVIDFEVKDMGPSGVGVVELWYTRDGQTWARSPGAPQKQSPFVLDVSDDGLYGFTVVASNGMGIGKTTPLPGDVPQMWVDVDTTNPAIRLNSTKAGADENGRTLTLHWVANDRNLVPRPITLFYAESSDGPWIPFATNVENTGSYTWHMSPGVPPRVLVRVQATDRVGNIGEDETTVPSPIDLSRPTATIRNVTRNGTLEQVDDRK